MVSDVSLACGFVSGIAARGHSAYRFFRMRLSSDQLDHLLRPLGAMPVMLDRIPIYFSSFYSHSLLFVHPDDLHW